VTTKQGTKKLAPEWLQDLTGADIVFGNTPPPKFKSEKWTINFWLPEDLSELEEVTDPLLLIYAGAGFLREIESRMDALVAMARAQGRSWSEIGRALGVTKQTAWVRFSGGD
jgi:hypothetical protein